MNKKIVKLSTVTLTLIIVLSSVMAFYKVAAQARPTIYFDPAEAAFFTTDTSVGDTFAVTVKSADFPSPGVYSFEFRVRFDSTMLRATAASIPTGHWLTPSLAPGNLFVVDPGTINANYVSFAATLLGAEPGKTGGGTIAVVTFEIIAAPDIGQELASDIYLAEGETVLVDPSAAEIPKGNYDRVPSKFTYGSPPPPEPYMSVSSWAWDNQAAEDAGRLFNITVSINDLVADWHAVGFQFRLGFDNALIATQTEWVFEGDFAKQFGETFFVAFVEEKVIVGQLVLPDWPDPADLNAWMHGSGIIATIQFEAIYEPPPAAECALELSDIQIVDYQGNLIPFSDPVSGTYMITIAPPPWLSVAPQEVELEKIGESFDLNIIVNELDKGFQMVGVEFKVFYDTTILETSVEAITEGIDNIMREVATRSGTDLFFQAYLEEDHGLIGIIILPLPDGTWPFFPEGTGVLAAVEFTAIQQLDDVDLITTVNVDDVLLVNADAKAVPLNLQKTEAEGTCTVTIKKAFAPPPAERMVDLYTQYDAPYGGQGANAPSDAFAPQGQVKLYAKVTYRGDAIPGKPVAYQIIGPNGYEFSAIAFTNANGQALLDFSMPASSIYFGVWSISASVDVAGQVVTDTLFFRFGWLVEVKSIAIDPNDGTIPIGAGLQKLFKGKTYSLHTILKIITMQHPTECVQLQGIEPKTMLSYAGFDELRQPLFNKFVDLTASIGPWMTAPTVQQMTDFVADEEGREFDAGTVSIAIPRSAYSGIGNIYVNIYTDYPWVSGVPYSDPKIGAKEVWIQAPAEAPPPPGPVVSTTASLTASSKTWTNKAANSAGRNFVITIGISNVNPEEHITAIQFELEYDPKLIEALEVTEGSFVKQFGETFFVFYIGENGGKKVIVGELQLPPYPGEKGWMAGTGTLCTIKFNAVYSPPPIGTCVLALKNAYMVNAEAEPIQFKYVENGYYVITP